MIIDRATAMGPAKITLGETVIYSEGDVATTLQRATRPVPSSVMGNHDETVQSNHYETGFTPKSVWSYHDVLYPAALIAPACMGGRLFAADADVPLVIGGSDGQQITHPSVALLSPPDMFLGVGKSLWGAVKLAALYAQGADTSDEDSLIALDTWEPYFTDHPAEHIEEIVLGAWGTGEGNPFAAMRPQAGWTIKAAVETEPIHSGKQIVNYRLKSAQYMVSGLIENAAQADLLAANVAQGTGAGPGYRLSAGAKDLVLTGSFGSLTAKACALKSGGFQFGQTVLRNGEFGWVTTGFGPRLVFADAQ